MAKDTININLNDKGKDKDQEKTVWISEKRKDSYNPKQARNKAIDTLAAYGKKITAHDIKDIFLQYYYKTVMYELTIGENLPDWTTKKEADTFGIAVQRYVDDDSNENGDNLAKLLVKFDQKGGRLQKEFDKFTGPEIMIYAFSGIAPNGTSKMEAKAFKKADKLLSKAAKAEKKYNDAFQNIDGLEYFKKRLGDDIKEINSSISLNY